MHFSNDKNQSKLKQTKLQHNVIFLSIPRYLKLIFKTKKRGVLGLLLTSSLLYA